MEIKLLTNKLKKLFKIEPLNPKYTYVEDMLNAFTHLIAFIVILLIGIEYKDILSDSLIVYIFALLFMFRASFLYHLEQDQDRKLIRRKIDHMMTFVLFVATFILYYEVSKGLYMLILLLLVGTGLIIFDIDRTKYIKHLVYFLMALIFFYHSPLNPIEFYKGLAVYLIGFIIYNIGYFKRGYHTLWHIVSFIGTLIHLFGVL